MVFAAVHGFEQYVVGVRIADALDAERVGVDRRLEFALDSAFGGERRPRVEQVVVLGKFVGDLGAAGNRFPRNVGQRSGCGAVVFDRFDRRFDAAAPQREQHAAQNQFMKFHIRIFFQVYQPGFCTRFGLTMMSCSLIGQEIVARGDEMLRVERLPVIVAFGAFLIDGPAAQRFVVKLFFGLLPAAQVPGSAILRTSFRGFSRGG